MRKTFSKKFIASLISFAFGLNFLWEISQMFLYADHTNGFADFVLVHIKASLGDLVIFTIIYLIGLIFFRNAKWFAAKGKLPYFFAAMCGFLIATLIEKYALETNRWQYNNLMPIVPFFKVGLVPILQMIILPWITILFAKKNI